jgi:hypothetical protein
MSRRKSIDFTSTHSVRIHQGADGKYWSQIMGPDGSLWEMVENTDSYDDAATLAKYRLDALAEQYVTEGE